MSGYRPRRLQVPELSDRSVATLLGEFRSIAEEAARLAARDASIRIETGRITVRAGQYVRVSPPTSGQTVILESAKPTTVGRSAQISVENPRGTLTIVAAPDGEHPGTVNQVAAVQVTTAGTVELVSNGQGGWFTAGTGSAPAVAAGTGIDVATSGGVVTISLEPIAPERVLGNDTSNSAAPTPITVHQELDWLTDDWVFDGVDDQVQMGDVLDMTRTTPRTILVWYSTTDTSGPCLVGKQANSTAAGWRFCISTTPLDFILRGATQQLQVGATSRPPRDGTEHHFGFTYDGSSAAAGVTMYLDGASVPQTIGTDTLTSDSTVNAQPLQFGMRGTPPDAAYAGSLRHISIWSRELTALEVAQVYGGGTPPDLALLSFFADCIGWWKLDATDTTGAGGIADYSASNNDGTASGGLSPTVAEGVLPVRGSTVWQVISPGTSGLPLCSNGAGAIPSYRVLPNSGLATATANTYKGNATGSVASVTDNAISGLAGAGMTATGSVLNVIGSTSITVNANDVQRPALTGDVTASANSNALTIANDAVTFAKMQNIVTDSLIGRDTAATGDPENITLNATLSMTGAGALQRAALTGDVTAPAGSNATTLANAVVTPTHLAVEASSRAADFCIHVACPSGGAAGTADDVTVFNANAPFAFRIERALLRVSTAVALSTAALRTASGGGGTVVLPDATVATQTFSTAVAGAYNDNAAASATVAANGSLFLRRSDRSVVGELTLFCVRT